MPDSVLYILDTDTVSLFQRGNTEILKRREEARFDAVCVSIITIEEQLAGWYALLRRPLPPTRLAEVYQQMTETLTFLASLPIISFNEAAIHRFEQLKALKLNVGSNDLRIAAITLESTGILVTRNHRDFARVPDLQIEDWTEQATT